MIYISGTFLLVHRLWPPFFMQFPIYILFTAYKISKIAGLSKGDNNMQLEKSQSLKYSNAN